MGTTSSAPVEKPQHITVEFDVSCSIPVEEIVKISEQAGKAIMEIYNSADHGVEMKGDESPLTKADTESNRIICEGLQRNYQYCWVVDPLDGTKEFIKRNGEFTVMIGLVQGSTAVLGVVHVPVSGKTYYAVAGKGAYVRDAKGNTKQVHAKEFSVSDPGLVLVGSTSHANPTNNTAMKDFVELFDSPQFSSYGSSLKLLMVAEGSAHVYPRLAPTMEWDSAAADIIVKEAGGVVLQAGKITGKGELLEDWKDVLMKELPMEYNKEDLLNPCFVVFGKRRT
ncbi:hypothetical protein COO60DRAFT_1470341 [Scenedesmus sp. NREL 46B-D3]|nr:hypothetical protein COO60DRAFT_1470341 [Scenedesmus sp. NREL 46B-D3]